MKIVKFWLLTGLAFGLSFAAADAQQNVAKATRSDIQYCHALSHAYSGMYPVNEAMPVADAMALGGCDTDTQKTIATLERMLKDQKIELPPRGIAQAPASIDETPCTGEPTATSCSDYGP